MHDLKMTDWKLTDKETDFTIHMLPTAPTWHQLLLGSRGWSAMLLLLLVDAVVVVDDLSEIPSAVYP